MNFGTQARAEWRVLLSAALIGSGIGLAVGATYMAGVITQAGSDYSRSGRIAQAAAGGFSDSVLQGEASPASATSDVATQDGFQVRAAASGRLGSALNRNRELDCLTQAVYFEARGETAEGQLAVAEVILNRVASEEYPDTICDVVTQPSQFSFIRAGKFPSVDTTSATWHMALAIADIATKHLAREVAPNVLWYHASYVAPAWGHRLTRFAQIGTHIFYS